MGAAASVVETETQKPADASDVTDADAKAELARLRSLLAANKDQLLEALGGGGGGGDSEAVSRLQAEIAHLKTQAPQVRKLVGEGFEEAAFKWVPNDTALPEPTNPNLMHHTILFLPPRAVDEFGLEPNMSDKGDLKKTMWVGRVWELRAILAIKHKHKASLVGGALDAARLGELDAVLADPSKKTLLSRMGARWRGATLRKLQTLDFLEPLRWANLRGTCVYAHGSGGCSWDNYRICRLICSMGMLVVAPDGFGYPSNTAMGQMRHKDSRPILTKNEDVDYWANDLVYLSGATGELTYSTNADSVLEDPNSYRDLYEKCYQLRRAELHFIISRLPKYARVQGFFLGGTSEGAMTCARFDDQRYGGMLIGRFINSFSIEYCYFTPREVDGRLGGQLDVPTLNIIGTHDEYFGNIESVAKLVAEDPETGFGKANLDGHGYSTLVEQGCTSGLVAYLEGGVHGPCATHDNFLRDLFMTFFTRPGAIYKLPRIWSLEPTKKVLVELLKSTEQDPTPVNVALMHVPVMKFPQIYSLRQVEHFRELAMSGFKGSAAQKAKEALDGEIAKEKIRIEEEHKHAHSAIDAIRNHGKKLKVEAPATANNFYSADKHETGFSKYTN